VPPRDCNDHRSCTSERENDRDDCHDTPTRQRTARRRHLVIVTDGGCLAASRSVSGVDDAVGDSDVDTYR
jgi:hypothetical protein